MAKNESHMCHCDEVSKPRQQSTCDLISNEHVASRQASAEVNGPASRVYCSMVTKIEGPSVEMLSVIVSSSMYLWL